MFSLRASYLSAITILLATLMFAPACTRRIEAPESASWRRQLDALSDDPAKHLTISWQGSPYAEGGRPGSWIQRRIEERFNVNLAVDFIPTFSYDRLMRFKLLGGDIPDVFWVRDARDAKNAAEQGFASEVPYEALARFAPDYVRQLQEYAPDAWLLSLYRGRNYGVPTFDLKSAPWPCPGLWNQAWLERVGIHKTPETLDEMEEALRRFRQNDPDRDGRQDTYGMCPWRPGSVYSGLLDRSFEEIFGAFGVAQNAWQLRDGRVVWGGVLPEAKEALTLLRRWYAEGLIHPDYMTLPVGNISVRQQLISGTVGYIMGYNLGLWNAFEPRFANSVAALHSAVHPGEKIVPGNFPIGPRGQRGVRSWSGSVGGVMMFGPQIARAPEKLARVLTIFNAVCRDDELALELRVGRRGLQWTWDEAVGIRKLPPYDNKALGAAELLGELPTMSIDGNLLYFIPFSAGRELADQYTPQIAKDFRERYQKPEWGIKDVLLMAETVPSSGKYLPPLVDLQAISFTEIITGKKPLEAFDDFVADWRRRGGDVLTREANVLYGEKQAIADRVRQLTAVKSTSRR